MGITVIDNTHGFQQVGNKLEAFVDVTGPSLYATGGVAVSTSNMAIMGMSTIEYISAGVSSDGTYYVYGRTPSGNRSSSSYKLVWTVVATGAEAGAIDLSGSTVRLCVRGY